MKKNIVTRNIAFIVTTPMTASSFLMNYFNYLNSKGYNIYLFSDFSTSLFDCEYVHKVNISICRKVELSKDLVCLYQIFHYLKKYKIDIVHSITPKAGLLSAISGKLAGTRFRYHTFTGQVWANYPSFKKVPFKIIDKLIYSLNTSCLADSHSQREFLIKSNTVGERVQVLCDGSISGVDADKFSPCSSTKVTLRKDLQIPESNIVFLFLGRINKDKGVIDLIEAFQSLNDIKDKITLLLVGPDEGDILTSVEFDNIKTVGFTNTPEKYMQMSDVFCLPSYREGFGTVVIEAASCELPAIVSDIYGLSDAVIDGNTGLIHKVGDVYDISSKMRTFYENKELSLLLGKNARLRAKRNYCQNKLAVALFDFYESRIK